MTTQTDTAPHRVARILNFCLILVIIFIAAALLLMVLGTILMVFDTPFKDMVVEELGKTDQAIPSASALSSAFAGGAVIAGAYLYVALVVKRIVKTTLDGNPFVEANISRLRKTWIVIAFVEIFRIFITGFISRSSAGDNALDSFSMETRLSAWFLVFVIAIMAEVFRVGLELKRDQELTV